MIDAAGKLIVLEVVEDDEVTLRRTASAQSRFRKEAVAVTVTSDDEHIVAVTNNEMAVFSADTLSRIWSKTEKNVDWTGMMAIDHLVRARGHSVDDGDGGDDGDDQKEETPFFVFLWESNAENNWILRFYKSPGIVLECTVLMNVNYSPRSGTWCTFTLKI